MITYGTLAEFVKELQTLSTTLRGSYPMPKVLYRDDSAFQAACERCKGHREAGKHLEELLDGLLESNQG